MAKEAISVTLKRENLSWLRGQLRLRGARSVSEVLDEVVSMVRMPGRLAVQVQSVKGSIRIAEDDPNLERADEMLLALFSRHLSTRPRGRGGPVGAVAPLRRHRGGA
ncbi:MAG: hypothetical protein U0587_17635 [Candidatus Binatia bacterium]